MDYSYEELLEDVGMGREVEFFYKGNQYYIEGNFRNCIREEI